MLVLTRKQGETIHIGESITIMIKRVADGRVRVGVCAPHHTAIVRGELYKEALLEGPAVAAQCRCLRLKRRDRQPQSWPAAGGG
jgi:carbon storage regulator